MSDVGIFIIVVCVVIGVGYLIIERLAINNAAKTGKSNLLIKVTSATSILQAAAKKGDIHAQATLGRTYLLLPADKDINKALFWLTKAAENGNPYAQFDLGCLYEGESGVNGLGIYKEFGVQPNTQLSDFWFTKAKAQGITFKNSSEMPHWLPK